MESMPLLAKFELYLPHFASNVRVSEAVLHISAVAPGIDLKIAGRDQTTGEAVHVATLKNLDRKKDVTIRQAGRFQDVGRGALILEVQCSPNEGFRDETMSAGWSLTDISVTLRGTAM